MLGFSALTKKNSSPPTSDASCCLLISLFSFCERWNSTFKCVENAESVTSSNLFSHSHSACAEPLNVHPWATFFIVSHENSDYDNENFSLSRRCCFRNFRCIAEREWTELNALAWTNGKSPRARKINFMNDFLVPYPRCWRHENDKTKIFSIFKVFPARLMTFPFLMFFLLPQHRRVYTNGKCKLWKLNQHHFSFLLIESKCCVCQPKTTNWMIKETQIFLPTKSPRSFKFRHQCMWGSFEKILEMEKLFAVWLTSCIAWKARETLLCSFWWKKSREWESSYISRHPQKNRLLLLPHDILRRKKLKSLPYGELQLTFSPQISQKTSNKRYQLNGYLTLDKFGFATIVHWCRNFHRTYISDRKK